MTDSDKNMTAAEERPPVIRLETGRKFKILSIDGGGIRGLIPCKLLAKAEEELQRREGRDARLADYFDLICGTSTGSLIAIGLALGLTAAELLKFYEEKGEEVFPADRRSWTKKLSNWMLGQSFYERHALRRFVKEVYGRCSPDGDTRLGHARTRVLVPSYNGETGGIYVFRTAHSPHQLRDYQVPALAVALSSSAAPMYFRPYSFAYAPKGTREKCVFRHMVDGGVVANNPAFLGLSEAVKELGVPLEQVALLSLGTGAVGYSVPLHRGGFAPHFWKDPISAEGMRLFNAIISAQSRDVHDKLRLLQCGLDDTGREQRFDYLRVQHSFGRDEFVELDDASKESLLRMSLIAYELYDTYGATISRTFLQERCAPFVPLAAVAPVP